MSQDSDSDLLALTALLSSRLCHDLISPVGALVNGLELLEDDGSQDMREFAMELISKSAYSASCKLKFCRMAFGASSSGGSSDELDLGEAHDITQSYIEGEKSNLIWHGERSMMEKNKVKLLLNLILVSLGSLPRGGTITLTIDTSASFLFHLLCVGTKAKIPDDFVSYLSAVPDISVLTPHSIQHYYTFLLSRCVGASLDASMDGDDVVITASL